MKPQELMKTIETLQKEVAMMTEDVAFYKRMLHFLNLAPTMRCILFCGKELDDLYAKMGAKEVTKILAQNPEAYTWDVLGWTFDGSDQSLSALLDASFDWECYRFITFEEYELFIKTPRP